MMHVLPFLTSILTGIICLRLLFLRKNIAPALLVMLGSSLGISLSGLWVILSLLLFGQMIPFYLWLIHALLLTGGLITLLLYCPPGNRLPLRAIERSDYAGFILTGLLTIPIISHAVLYPQGGWDAWSCWNLKARFIFLGGENWKAMFDPLLWRSNIAYPFLLPAINAWNWSVGSTPVWTSPLALSCLISFLTAGTLLFFTKKLTGRLHAFLAPAWLFSIFFIVQLASSQYSDLLLGLYLLNALGSFLCFRQSQENAWLIITALSLGLMSFTKSEGMVLALISAATLTAWLGLFWRNLQRKRGLIFFITILGICLTPGLVYQLFLTPESLTFINGLSSAEKPTSLPRLQAILVFTGLELISPKWNGFWVITLTGSLLAGRRTLRKDLLFIPVILCLYLLAVVGVYWINTFFEIVWWLSTTLNRILYALIPVIILWLFLLFEQTPDQEQHSPRK